MSLFGINRKSPWEQLQENLKACENLVPGRAWRIALTIWELTGLFEQMSMSVSSIIRKGLLGPPSSKPLLSFQSALMLMLMWILLACALPCNDILTGHSNWHW